MVLDFQNKGNIDPWKVKTKKLKGAVVVTDSFSIVTQVSRSIRKRLLLTLFAVTLYFYYYAFSRSCKALHSWIDSSYRSLKGSLLFGIKINQLCPLSILKLLSSCYGDKKGNEHPCKRGSSVSIQLGLMVWSCRNSFMFWDGICSWMENTKSKNGRRIRKNFYSDSVAFGERFHHS